MVFHHLIFARWCTKVLPKHSMQRSALLFAGNDFPKLLPKLSLSPSSMTLTYSLRPLFVVCVDKLFILCIFVSSGTCYHPQWSASLCDFTWGKNMVVIVTPNQSIFEELWFHCRQILTMNVPRCIFAFVFPSTEPRVPNILTYTNRKRGRAMNEFRIFCLWHVIVASCSQLCLCKLKILW